LLATHERERDNIWITGNLVPPSILTALDQEQLDAKNVVVQEIESVTGPPLFFPATNPGTT